jgi:mycobactin peptide synthetase MbtE
MDAIVSNFDIGGFDFSSMIQPQWLDATAIEFGETQLSYRGLREAVEARVATLSAAICKGQVVALEMSKSADYVVNLLAILSAGAVVVPIDPSLPELRRSRMLNMIAPTLRVRPNVDLEVSGTVITPMIQRKSDVPAYVFFTSGSTGTPKAIIGSLMGLLQFIHWQGREFKVGPGHRVSFLTAIGFDVSLRDILLPLLHGATLAIPESEDAASPQATVDWLIRSRITHVHAVPSIARLWARSKKEGVLAIKTLFLAGEKLTAPLLAELREAFIETDEIVNLYGPTETTLAKFYHRLDAADFQRDADDPDIPVGKPLPGTQFYLAAAADDAARSWGRPNISQSFGEVVIVTPYASFGYLGSPEDMQNRFQACSDGMVAYRTGDLGRLTASGDLVIMGRRDDEVKINGIRIHPLEVEKAVASAPMVRDVAVVAQQRGDGELRLMAFWTAKAGESAQPHTAPRAHALSLLPRALVPTIWTRLEALPLNSNGKVDRKALPELAQRGDPRLLPRDAASHWLVGAVANILGIEIPSLGDDFFALGGTSLHVAFLIGRIKRELSKTIEFAALFEAPRLGSIADLIRAAPADRKVQIQAIANADSYPLSPQQRRWWNIYLPECNRSWATMVRSISLKGRFSTDAIREVVCDIVAAQDSMRLFFSKSNGKLRQHLHDCRDRDKIPLVVHDFSGEAPEASSRKLAAIRLTIANGEIDPLVWPLFRINVVAMPNGHTSVILAIHHMVSDGFSVGLLENALRNALERDDRYAPDLPFNYLSYAQWALQEEEHAFGPGSAAHVYWHELFRDPYQKIVFPERWVGDGHDRGQGYCHLVPAAIRAAVVETARRERLPEFSIYLAAKFLAWHEMLGREDIVIGTPAAGRDVPGTEGILGNFISLVLMSSRGPDRGNPIGYTREIMRSVAHAMTFQGYQYDRLVRSLGLPFEQDRFPLTTIFISYLNFDDSRAQPLAQAELGHSDLGLAVKFDVMSYVREHKDATSLQVQYRNNLFRAEEITAFVDRWLNAVQRIAMC